MAHSEKGVGQSRSFKLVVSASAESKKRPVGMTNQKDVLTVVMQKRSAYLLSRPVVTYLMIYTPAARCTDRARWDVTSHEKSTQLPYSRLASISWSPPRLASSGREKHSQKRSDCAIFAEPGRCSTPQQRTRRSDTQAKPVSRCPSTTKKRPGEWIAKVDSGTRDVEEEEEEDILPGTVPIRNTGVCTHIGDTGNNELLEGTPKHMRSEVQAPNMLNGRLPSGMIRGQAYPMYVAVPSPFLSKFIMRTDAKMRQLQQIRADWVLPEEFCRTHNVFLVNLNTGPEQSLPDRHLGGNGLMGYIFGRLLKSSHSLIAGAKILASTSTMLFLMATAHIGLSLRQLLEALIFVPQSLVPSYATLYFSDFAEPLAVAKTLLCDTVVLVTDVVLIWRLYVVWDRRHIMTKLFLLYIPL
ncbi:hypothetical protein CERSUDRAFT_124704 [Gelatoporia subvermispora B]|uniref:Uncharacterized protein n=1 Tax=Ceriporiopsis subvermispora (strain B) TaxID=914234 RepID=M2QE94_CERS8|nr:hypothetical protein CERSUDRAFT_124704 [Gelatoporia subvermispora B]